MCPKWLVYSGQSCSSSVLKVLKEPELLSTQSHYFRTPSIIVSHASALFFNSDGRGELAGISGGAVRRSSVVALRSPEPPTLLS